MKEGACRSRLAIVMSLLVSCVARSSGTLRFTKMHGAGNDYVYVDCFGAPPPADPPALARAISDRRTGVGGDGLILIAPSEIADARMIMFNADGSRAQMCGNGIRCVAKYLYDHGLARKETLRIETDSGVKPIRVRLDGGRVVEATVDMGPPVLLPERVTVEVKDPPGRTFEGDRVSMGNPHFVVFLDEDPAAFPVERYGPAIERHPLFPERTNVEFVRVAGRGEIHQRTWERGTGETWACGTGACAAAVATLRRGLADREVLVHLRGGDLRVSWDGRGPVYLTGPATEVFSGEWAR